MRAGDNNESRPAELAAQVAAKTARLISPIAAPWGGDIHTGELAQDAARDHDELVQALVTLHRSCGHRVDWASLAALDAPPLPAHANTHEKRAQKAYDNFRPSLISRLMGQVKHQRRALKHRIAEAWVLDDRIHAEVSARHERDLQQHEETTGLARRVLAREPSAFTQAIAAFEPLAPIGPFGERAVLTALGPAAYSVRMLVKPVEILPRDRVRQLASGRIAVAPYPRPEYCRLLRDHVCSAGLRAARELFALLPLEEIVVTVVDSSRDAATGQPRRRTLLRFGAQRTALDALDFYELDSAEAMLRLWHRADFEGSGRLAALEPEFAETD